MVVSVENDEIKKEKQRKLIRNIMVILAVLVVVWFSLVLVEYSRVKSDKKPLVCFGEIKDVEDDDEYSKMCYGILYKYKEYYYNDNDVMSARELVLFFQDFERRAEE